MKTLQESILSGDAERAADNAALFVKVKKWLDYYGATVEGLKVNKDGTFDAEKIRFWAHTDLYTLPEYLKFNYVKSFAVDSCQNWHGYKGFPKKCDKLYLRDIYGMKDLKNLEDSEIGWLCLDECHGFGRNLGIPKNHKIKSMRFVRCSYGRWDDTWEGQLHRAHITWTP